MFIIIHIIWPKREMNSSNPALDGEALGARCIKMEVLEPEDKESIAGPQTLWLERGAFN